MKRFVSVFVCVLCVMLASILRHVILAKAAPAAAEYSRRSSDAVLEELSLFMEDEPLFTEIA